MLLDITGICRKDERNDDTFFYYEKYGSLKQKQ